MQSIIDNWVGSVIVITNISTWKHVKISNKTTQHKNKAAIYVGYVLLIYTIN